MSVRTGWSSTLNKSFGRSITPGSVKVWGENRLAGTDRYDG